MSITQIIALIALALATLIALTMLLPKERIVSRSTVVNAKRADVYALFAGNRAFQKVNPYNSDPSLKITHSGPETGVGSKFAFEGQEGKGTQTIIATTENKSVEVEIDLGAMGKPHTTWKLSDDEKGNTKVVWQTKSDLGYNPIARVFGLFLDGMLGPIYEKGLANIGPALDA